MSKSYSKSQNRMKKLLILAVSALIAAALGVTCLLWGGESSPVTVDGVGAGEALTSTAYSDSSATGNKSGAGALVNGDTLTYNYTGSVVNVTLPAGTFTLEVWGAQGGVSSHASSAGNTGGYTKGTYVISATTTLYIAVGGKGTDGNYGYTGGWNGGGDGGKVSTDTGGGGGATHIATRSGLLRDLSSYKSNVLVVAGGGGGNGCSNWIGGKGGGGLSSSTSTGGAGSGGSSYSPGGVGATTSGPGTVRSGGTVGGFGYGGWSRSSYLYGCGGGGGGYYGGSAGANLSGGGASGGGGSGYVNTSYISGYSGTQGGRTGNGLARITVVNVNRAPNSRNQTFSGKAVGVAGSVTITSNDLATDPDSHQSAEERKVFFTDGNTGNLNSYYTSANSGIFLNSSCTTLASNYIDWTWSGNTSFTVTRSKMYPRNGVDGCSLNGRLTLYAKIRDNFGSSTQHGWTVVTFYYTIPKNTGVTLRTGTAGSGEGKYFVGLSNTSTPPTVNATASTIYNPNGPSRNTLILERSLKYNTPLTISAASLLNGVVNSYTNSSGGTVAYSKALIGINSTTNITGSARKYRINEYDNLTGYTGHKITSYNASKVQIANTFDQLTFVCLTPDPTYQVFSVTLYVVENSTAYGSGFPNVVPDITPINLDIVFKMDNTRPVLKDMSSTVPVFTVDAMKTAPVDLNKLYTDVDTGDITASTHTIRAVKVATHEYVQVDKYGKLVSTVNTSGSNRDKSYFNVVQGTPNTDMLSEALTTGMLTGTENETGFKEWYISGGASNVAFIQYSFSGVTLNITGLRSTYNMYKSTRASSKIATSGSVRSGDSAGGLTCDKTGALNAGDFYILINFQDKNDTADGGIWLPLGIRVNNAQPTDLSKERGGAGASVMPTASGTAGKSFFFTPMGITVDKTTYAVGKRKLDGGALTSDELYPLAADSDNFFTTNMLNGSATGGSGDAGLLNELVTLTSDAAAVRTSVNHNASAEYFDVTEIDIYIPKDYFGGRVKVGSLPEESVDYHGDGNPIPCVKIKGLKITLNNWTHNRYLHATVNVHDSASTTSVAVYIAVNVTNSAPTVIADETKIAHFDYVSNGMTVSSSFAVESGIPTVTYNIPVNSSVLVTPYDLMTDVNMTKNNVAYPPSGFTLNGLSGLFDPANGVYSVDYTGEYASDKRMITGIGATAATEAGGLKYATDAYFGSLKSTLTSLAGTRTFDKLSSGNSFASSLETVKTTRIDRLYFERKGDSSNLDGYTFAPYVSSAADFADPAIVGSSFVGYDFGHTLKFKNASGVYDAGNTHNIDYIVITAKNRTQVGAPAEITLNLRDATGSGGQGDARGVGTVKVRINVINSTPSVQDRDRIYTLSTGGVGSINVTSVPDIAPSVIPTSYVIYAAGYTSASDLKKNFLVDNEGDAVSFYTAFAPMVYDEDGSDMDVANGVPYSSYISVGVLSDRMTITALNSTQSLKALYVVFHATDGRSSSSGEVDHGECRIRVEVVNSKPVANVGADGFSVVDDKVLWNVESLNNVDNTRTRYIVSNDAVSAKLQSEGASAAQIKKAVSDTDRLQGVVFAPAKYPGQTDDGQREYITAAVKQADGSYVIPADCKYNLKVPYASYTFDTTNEDNMGVAVYIRIESPGTGGQSLTLETPTSREISDYDIFYFVEGNKYSARELRKGAAGAHGDVVNQDPEKFFDSQGRWKVTDWAVAVTPAGESEANHYIRMEMMLKDQTEFGGGTSNRKTAYNKGVAANVDGFLNKYYYLFINGIGIVPYTYYNQFDGYYTVADAQNSSDNYIVTYDGYRDSVYSEPGSAAPTVPQPASTAGSIYLDGGKITTTSSGTELKARGNNVKDDIAAGVHSGEKYVAGKDYTDGYTVYYKAGDGSIVKATDATEHAFKFSDTIKVSGEKGAGGYPYTYVPMSYLALRRGFISADRTTGAVSYDPSFYVGYDIPGNEGYNRKTDYARAITISDGTKTWSGSETAVGSRLEDNPYVSFTSFDAYSGGSVDASETGYVAARNGEYFNKCLAIPSVDESGNALDFFTKTAEQTAANAKNLIGPDGRLMYIEDQETLIQENLFGFGIKKKNTRSSATSLTITIAVAQCTFSGSVTRTSYTDSTKDKNTAKVSFKLEIGNSPIKLVQSSSPDTGVKYDSAAGYYTNLDLTTADAEPATLTLTREITSKADRTITYSDDDAVFETKDNKDVLVEERSDKAYFYADSVHRLNNWAEGETAYKRVAKYKTNAGGDKIDHFENTALGTLDAEQYAQKSIQNYFGSRSTSDFDFSPATTVAQMSAVTGSFQPNGGIYGTNMTGGTEGFSSYFTVGVSTDGSTLSITPHAKTTINDAVLEGLITSSTDAEQIYNERGLEFDGSRGYYPLKILIYDSHGDGVLSASFVALEIRVYIRSSAPAFSSNLEDDTAPGTTKGDKKLSVSLPKGQNYTLKLSDVIRSSDLLSTGSRWFWQSDYDELLASTSKSKVDEFNLESGTYLMSPFAKGNVYDWKPATQNDNAALRKGDGKLFDTLRIEKDKQPDVTLSMEYKGTDTLTNESQPAGNEITVSVNRRTTYDNKTVRNFVFKLVFSDSDNHNTSNIRIYVEVTNQAPTVRGKAVEIAANLQMRVKDSFTVLTTPYDNFSGTGDYVANRDSATASTSVKTTATSDGRKNISDRNLLKAPGDKDVGTSVKYEWLTTSALDDEDGAYRLHSYDRESVEIQDLGYLALADDDTPWALRIESISYYDSSCFLIPSMYDQMYMEGKMSGSKYPISAVIVANKVCENSPITITLIDDEGARVTFTLYVTVVSSMPSAITDGDTVHKRHEALLTTYNEDKVEQVGVFETYMVSSAATSTKLTDVQVADKNNADDSGRDKVTVIKNVYGKLDLNVNQIAYDPDIADNNVIALYTDEQNDKDYDVFTFNDMPMTKEVGTGTYYNDWYKIVIGPNYRSFSIECLTYNPYSDWDELKFYVRDCGNNIFDQAIPIVIRISSLYSSVTNEHQSSTSKVTGGNIQTRTVDNVYVKPYDDYAGVSAEVKDLPEEEFDKIHNVDSTYKFLTYKGVEASVDQVDDGKGINDPDVLNNLSNLNYDIRVYALMNMGSSSREYKSLTVGEASPLFDLTPDRLAAHTWYFKEDEDTQKKISSYLVGGQYAGGGAYGNINRTLAMFLQDYFVFSIGDDGVSLSFQPVTANLNTDILFYVQIEKQVDYRRIYPAAAATKCGTLFYVKVKDSAPVANEDEKVLSFTGKVNDSCIFPIHDPADPFGSLFTDSDKADVVKGRGFDGKGDVNANYETALAKTDVDWRMRSGVPRALTIEINNTDSDIEKPKDAANYEPEAYVIPAHSLRVKINRRIDELDEKGNYKPDVTFPVVITGYDLDNREASVELSITVQNSNFDMAEERLTNAALSGKYDVNGVGYDISADEEHERTYILDTKIAPDSATLNVNFVTEGWFSDPDNTTMKRDMDSYRLVRPENVNAAKYIVDETMDVVADESTEKIGTIEPIFGNNGEMVNAFHFAGIKITATSYKRGITGTLYLRILDRSGDATKETNGITIVVNVTVLNAAPTVKSGMDVTTMYITGSDTKAPDPINIDINDYVTDLNGDRLSVYSRYPAPILHDPDKGVYRTVYCTNETDNEGDMMELDSEGATLRILPRKGFYGTQQVKVVVADGDIATDPAARTVEFTITLVMQYDNSQIVNLNTLTAKRSLPRKVLPTELIKDIVDTYVVDMTNKEVSPVLASADGEAVYSPGKEYMITELVSNSTYAEVSKDNDGDWQFVCSRESDEITFTVTMVRIADGGGQFTKTFNASVGKNSSPELLLNFKRDKFTFHTNAQNEYALNSNGTVAISTKMLFNDVDIADGDRLVFDPKSVSVVSPTMCSVSVSEDGALLYLTFNCRGETELTVGVKDRTGETITETITIANLDRPEPSFGDKIKISYETYPIIWLAVIIGVAALILLLILIILLLKRRKRKREELEAILISEMELEEQMMMLNASANAPYQSFGYLPPTVNIQNNPGMMLGSGTNAPPSDAIGLNPGQQNAPNQQTTAGDAGNGGGGVGGGEGNDNF